MRTVTRLLQERIETPVCSMLALASPTGLCGLEFDEPRRRSRLDARLARWFAPYEVATRRHEAEHESTDPGTDPGSEPGAAPGDGSGGQILDTARHWVDAYFEGERPDPRSVPLDLRGTPFELAVWDALLDVPFGSTASYGSLAAVVGRPKAARAVGLANGSNPVAILVPCHRIIGTNGSLTGYGGGLDRKEWLLRHESAPPFASMF